jgi:SAM-dependent methyltransferase
MERICEFPGREPALSLAAPKKTLPAWTVELTFGMLFHFPPQSQPNDEAAQQHMNLEHALFLKTLDDRLFLAPLPPTVQRVLDVGTGTGIWAIDFADQFPGARVVGTDLSPIQPTWVPANCRFEVDDAEAEWTFAANSFDFIHVRGLFGSIASWPRLYEQCLRALRPGGHIEQQEYGATFYSEDGTVAADSPMGRASAIAEDVFGRFGRDIRIMERMRGLMAAAGFVDVAETRYRWPVGPWPRDPQQKELGLLVRAHIEMGLEGWILRPFSELGWSLDEIQVLLARARRDIRDPNVHAIQEMRVCHARKPM